MFRNPEGRKNTDHRSISIETGVNAYAEGSALIRTGNTHVLCTASVEEKVPGWLEGKGRGWVTAEYSMLPRSTHTRSRRDRDKISGRTQEIQRLIARSLRAMINLDALGERMITVDCDVLQADGGTRTAAINGGCVALAIAIEKLKKEKKISEKAWGKTVSAISVGIKDKEILVDLDYQEDSHCDVDMNIVMMGTSEFVEVQGTAEKNTFNSEEFQKLISSAQTSIQSISGLQIEAIQKAIH